MTRYSTANRGISRSHQVVEPAWPWISNSAAPSCAPFSTTWMLWASTLTR